MTQSSGASATSAAVDQTDDEQLPEPARAAPAWFELGIVVVGVAMALVGGVGLLLADAGHYKAALAIAIGLVLTVVAAFFVARWPRPARPPGAALPAIVMIVVALGSFAVNAYFIGHHVWVERDPGVYAQTGQWLAQHGTLVVPDGANWAPIAGAHADITWGSAGMYPTLPANLQFQFAHFLPVLLAEAHALGGDQVMFRVPALLGAIAMCAVYAVGCRVVRRPWLVLAAVTGLAISLPQLAVSRDTYSETSTQIALWVGILLLLKAYENRRIVTVLLAGLMIGTTVMTRIDGVAYLIPLPVLAAVPWIATKTTAGRRRLLWMYGAGLVGLVPPVAIGTYDVKERSTGYWDALHSQVLHLYDGLVAAAVISVLVVLLWPRLPQAADWVVVRRRQIAAVTCWIVGIGLLLAWSIRPAIDHTTWDANAIAPLIKAEGLNINANRTLNEQSLIWISWYIGPVALALAIAGLCLLVARAIRNGSWPALVVLLMSAGITAIYIWDPSINPDQIWAMRRFVPGALPLLIIAAVIAVDFVATNVGRVVAGASWPIGVVVAGAVALIAFPLATTAPVARFQPQANYLGVITSTCKTIGPDAAVVFPKDDINHITLPQTIRSWCNVPAAALTKPTTPARLQEIAAAWKAQGRTLWVLGGSAALVASTGTSAQPVAIGQAVSSRELEQTVAYAPKNYTTTTLALYGVKVAP